MIGRRRARGALWTAGALLWCAGCTPSVWERSFVPAGPDARALAAEARAQAGVARREPARIREVPWERLEPTLREIRALAAASDVPPEQWSEGVKRDAHARLLRALQVTADPGSVAILGRSEFRTTEFARPDEPELASFAGSIGAREVVWSGRFVGRGERVEQRPVTVWTSGTAWDRDGRDRRRPESYTETSTAWVPVVIEADETGFVAFFLR